MDVVGPRNMDDVITHRGSGQGLEMLNVLLHGLLIGNYCTTFVGTSFDPQDLIIMPHLITAASMARPKMIPAYTMET